MARKTAADLDLLDDLNLNTDLRTTELTELDTKLPSHEVTESGRSDITASKDEKNTDLQTSGLPKYLQLVRKEVRLRADRLEKLHSLTLQLNRARRGKGERLTENTLIRIAIDLLLERSQDLSGITESELWKSVSLEDTNSGSQT